MVETRTTRPRIKITMIWPDLTTLAIYQAGGHRQFSQQIRKIEDPYLILDYHAEGLRQPYLFLAGNAPSRRGCADAGTPQEAKRSKLSWVSASFTKLTEHTNSD